MTRQLLESTLRVSTPLIFAALGGMFSERSGVINIALEGMMLIGAFGAAVGTFVTHSPWLGSASGIAAGVLLAVVYGLFVIWLRANQIVAGTAALAANAVPPTVAAIEASIPDGASWFAFGTMTITRTADTTVTETVCNLYRPLALPVTVHDE